MRAENFGISYNRPLVPQLCSKMPAEWNKKCGSLSGGANDGVCDCVCVCAGGFYFIGFIADLTLGFTQKMH